MPRIEEDVKLDFKDVLIRPKRSTLRSRSEVTLERTLTFKHSGRSLRVLYLVDDLDLGADLEEGCEQLQLCHQPKPENGGPQPPPEPLESEPMWKPQMQAEC